MLICMVAAFVSAPASASSPVGITITYAGDWEPDLLFADAFKQSRNWSTSSGAAAPIDANGWPTQDANIYVWAGQGLDMSGTYALSFNGQATVSCSGGTVSNQVYDPSANLTTATVTMTNSDLNLSFTSTRRTSSGAANTGVTNAKLMRPTSYGAATSYPTSTNFTTPIKNLISKFGTIRFMDYLATNGNAQVNWSDRVPPAYASYVVSDPAYGWEGKGCPWEYAVLLCNETGKDMWICIPAGATDAYITNVANLIAFGSDGTNPYGSPQAKPVYPPLNSNLKVYVEFSNEVWNTAGAFTQSGTNHDAAVSEVNAGGSPLNFDGDTNDWNWAARRTAKRTVEISNIFRSVFGDGAMMTRVRPVLESQEGYVAFWLLQQTHMLEDYYNCAGRVATPHPPAYYIYGGGGSAYYNPDNSSDALTLSNIWTSSTFDNAAWAPVCQSEAGYVLPIYGKRVAYEGGPSMDNTGHSESIKSQAWADPRMTTCVSSHQTAWDQNGGDLLCYFESTGDYQWAFAQDPAVLDTPKMLAIDAIDSSARASGTYGVAIPGSISASAYNSPEDWAGSNPSDLSANDSWTWTGYVVNNTATGAFSIKLNAGSSGTANSADIYVDGGLVGTIAIPNTGSNGTYQDSATLTTSTLAAGTHGVLLKARSGGFGVNTIIIASSATAAPAFTTEPTGQNVTAGGDASFIVVVSGSPAPTYQWRVSTDGGNTWTDLTETAPYSGTKTGTLTITGATTAMNGYQFRCVASNSVNPVTSFPATLTVTGLSDQAFLQQLFLDVLGRPIDSGAAAAFGAALTGGESRAAVLGDLLASTEYSQWQIEPVIRLYYAAFARMPDYAGLQNWSIALHAGAVTLTGAAEAFVASPEFQQTYGSLTDTQFVTLLYANVLGRAPDPAGLQAWLNLLAGGASRGTVLVGFSESDEFKADKASQVEILRLYYLLLQRMPTAAELQSWLAFLQGDDETDTLFAQGYPAGLDSSDYVQLVFQGFLRRNADSGALGAFGGALDAGTLTHGGLVDTLLSSAEFSQYVGPVSRLYLSAFRRVPDAPGLDNWVNYMRAGNTLESVADAFVASPEFQLSYGGLDDTQYVTLLYQNVLGRAPDPTGLQNWLNLLGSGSTRGQVLIGFSESQEAIALFAPTVRTFLHYFAFLNAAPTQSDLDYWKNYLTTLDDQMRDDLLADPGFTNGG